MDHPLQAHQQFVAKLKAKGVQTLWYSTPCCNNDLEDRVSPTGDRWTTMATCPHCLALYIKTTLPDTVVAEMPPVKHPTTQQIARERNNAGLTQTAAAQIVHAGLRTWQDWEAGTSRMHPGLWELFQIKLKETS